MKGMFTKLSLQTGLWAFLLLMYSFASAQITLKNEYQNYHSAPIGTFQGINFREAGFSGLYPIPGTDGKEFWTVSDRGVNVDAANANPSACRPTYDKIYAFPSYVPKIHRIRVSGDSIQILHTITMKRPDGTGVSGIINPTGFGSTTTEVASTDTVLNCNNFSSKITPKDVWGIDSEGIAVDKDGYFWICEEGGPTIWKLDHQGVVVKRFTPYANQVGATPYDIAIDSVFKFRKNNRGFEGISITPNGKIYAIIQSPILYPTKSVGEGTRIHRILEINPADNSTKMFAYLNDGIIGSSGSNQIRLRDWKIGDMAAINDHSFLVIEAALRGTSDIKRIYKVDIQNATPVSGGLYNGLTLEALIDANGLAANGIVPVQKQLFMDLLANGWPAALDKAEGLTILNDSTIAICNDNDYGQSSPLENGIATATINKSHLFIYGLSGENKLQDFVNGCEFFAGTINGDQNTCAYTGTNGAVATYTIWAKSASTYHWLLPSGATLISGKGTNTIQVKFQSSFTGGVLQVTILNDCNGQNAVRTLTLQKALPGVPNAIQGPPSVCSAVEDGVALNYEIATVEGASSYEWVLPAKAQLIAGQGTTSVNILFKPGYVTSTLKVRAVSACGKSAYQSIKVASIAPIRPGTISGRIYALCDSLNTATYTIQPVAYATAYTWSTNIVGASIINEGTTATITFPSFVTGTVSVVASNDCGSGPAKTITIFSKPQQPGTIAGEGEHCKGSVQVFAIEPVLGATSYQWSVGYSNQIIAGQGTNIVDVRAWVDGEIKVRALNSCSISNSTYGVIVTEQCADSVDITAEKSIEASVYPVPSTGVVTISFNTNESETYQFIITNLITGEVHYHESGISATGKNEITKDFGNLRNGIYIVKILSASVKQVAKIEIHH